MVQNRIVYVFFYPAHHRLAGQPCYVGKGRPGRWMNHDVNGSCNKRLRLIFQKYDYTLPVVVVRGGLTNDEASASEIALIKAIGRRDYGTGPLVNSTDGGEGIINPSLEVRQRMSAAAKKRQRGPHSAEARARMSAAQKGRALTPEYALNLVN